MWQWLPKHLMRQRIANFIGKAAVITLVSLSAACGSDTPTPEPTLAPTVAPTPTPTALPTVAPTVVSVLPTPAPVAASPLPQPTAVGAIPRYTYEVVKSYPHDPNAFTQGLLFDQGQLYESTGLKGLSSIRRVDLETGAVLATKPLTSTYFGEGIAIVGDNLYQLTWQEQTGFVYNKGTFEQTNQFAYPTEGWGITFDGAHLIMSDGTPRLYFWDPTTLAEVGTIDVHDGTGQPIPMLNELEYVKGEIFANIWQTDLIIRIDPATGAVIGVIDLSGLLPAADRTPTTDVLNGIAYLPEGDRLFVTGKRWPKLFEIRLLPQQ